MQKNGLLISAVLITGVWLSTGFADNQTPPNNTPAPATIPQTQTSNEVNKVGELLPLDISKLKSGEIQLNVGHYNQLPPFYFNNDNTKNGFGYDIFNEVAKKAGIPKVHFIGYDNNIDLNMQLQAGKIDVIANSWDLPGMHKQFLLTSPYYTKGGLGFLYYKQKGPFQTAADLKDHNIGVFKHGYADNYWLPVNGIPKENIKTYSYLKDLMIALRDNEIDVAVVYYPLAQLAQVQSGDKVDAVLVQPINDVYAVRSQDTELLNILNDAIADLSKQGSLEQIPLQYYTSPNPS